MVTHNASLVVDLGAHSLHPVVLVLAFEVVFGCEIPDAAADNFHTNKDAMGYIDQNS
jgi:acyl carrier protein